MVDFLNTIKIQLASQAKWTEVADGLHIAESTYQAQDWKKPRRIIMVSLEAGTAFEILSVDIADVDVGRNIGAQLQTDQAEADKRIAQAKAEERRAMAVAREQEMKAYVQEMQAKVVEAEAEVPKAMATALREGKLGVMDYYNMQNVISDTAMRKSIAGESGAPEQK